MAPGWKALGVASETLDELTKRGPGAAIDGPPPRSPLLNLGFSVNNCEVWFVCVVMMQTFDQFYRREFPVMVVLAAAVSGSRIAAEDIAQDAFARARHRWDELPTYGKPEAWVRRKTVTLALITRKRETKIRMNLDWSRLSDQPPNPTMWFAKEYRGAPRSNPLQKRLGVR